MITLKSGQSYNKAEFIKLVNSARINHKNSWIAISAIVDGHVVTYKAFGTWIHRMTVNAVIDSNYSDSSVKDYKGFMKSMLDI